MYDMMVKLAGWTLSLGSDLFVRLSFTLQINEHVICSMTVWF